MKKFLVIPILFLLVFGLAACDSSQQSLDDIKAAENKAKQKELKNKQKAEKARKQSKKYKQAQQQKYSIKRGDVQQIFPENPKRQGRIANLNDQARQAVRDLRNQDNQAINTGGDGQGIEVEDKQGIRVTGNDKIQVNGN